VVHQDGKVPKFQHARAAVFWGTDEHVGRAAKCLREFGKAAIDDGLFIAPVVTGARDFELHHQINELLDRVDPHVVRKSNQEVLTSPVDLHRVLHKFLAHEPGSARNVGLVIEGQVPVDQESRFLLQRAFHDCRSIKLEPIAPGYSGADTFIVKATLTDTNVPEPVAFFRQAGAA
jgi:hypothetical protein